MEYIWVHGGVWPAWALNLGTMKALWRRGLIKEVVRDDLTHRIILTEKGKEILQSISPV